MLLLDYLNHGKNNQMTFFQKDGGKKLSQMSWFVYFAYLLPAQSLGDLQFIFCVLAVFIKAEI